MCLRKNILFFAIIGCLVTSCSIKERSEISSIIGNKDWHKVQLLDTKMEQNNIFSIKINGNLVGSGFAWTQSSNFIMTNAHVAVEFKECLILNECVVEVGNKLNNAKISKIEIYDIRLDFAVLSTEIPLNGIMQLKFGEVTKEEHVKVMGFIDENELTVSSGKVTEIDTNRRVTPRLYHTADTLPGMSGSPVFNSQGEIIGIHFSGCDNNENSCESNKAVVMSSINSKYSLFR